MEQANNKADFTERILACPTIAEMIGLGQAEADNACDPQNECEAEYRKFISGVLYFLQMSFRPSGLSDADFALLRPIAEKLVGQDEMHAIVLELWPAD